MLERPISKAEWAQVSLGEVASNINDYFDRERDEATRYIAGEHVDEGTLSVSRWGGTDDDFFPPTFKRKFASGDVLFHSRNIKKVAVPNFSGVTGEKLFVLRSNDPSRLSQEFLGFVLASQGFHHYAERNWSGSVNKFFNWKPLSKFSFRLPPIQEQARLLEPLLAANSVVSELGSLAFAARQSMRALAKELFIERRKTLATTRIGTVATVRNGTTPSRKNPDFWNGTVPWLPTGKVNERYIEAADECITDLALQKCSLRLIPAGSTLVAMIGEGTTRGKAALLRIDATTNQNFAAVSPGEALVPEFLFYQLESCYEPLRHWSHGTNQHALNTKLVSDFPIWVPDVDEQKEIVAEIAALESQRVAAERRRDSFKGIYRQISEKVLEACWV